MTLKRVRALGPDAGQAGDWPVAGSRLQPGGQAGSWRGGPTGNRPLAQVASGVVHPGDAVIVLEREAAPHPLPRAVHIDHEMMRIFQSVGLA